jgi:hypothetical protein
MYPADAETARLWEEEGLVSPLPLPESLQPFWLWVPLISYVHNWKLLVDVEVITTRFSKNKYMAWTENKTMHIYI